MATLLKIDEQEYRVNQIKGKQSKYSLVTPELAEWAQSATSVITKDAKAKDAPDEQEKWSINRQFYCYSSEMKFGT